MAQQREATGRSYPAGVPCWVDTEQPDVEAAMHFYGGIFGWEFEDTAPSGSTGRYVIATLDGQEAGAITGPAPASPGRTHTSPMTKQMLPRATCSPWAQH